MIKHVFLYKDISIAPFSLMENVRVRRAGYAFRQTYEQFLHRYKMLSAATWPQYRGLASEGALDILNTLQVPHSEYAFGASKIFIRNPQLVSLC